MELHRARGSYVRFFAIAQDTARLGMKLDVKEPVGEDVKEGGQSRGQPVGSRSTTRGIDIGVQLSNRNEKSSCSKCDAEDIFQECPWQLTYSKKGLAGNLLLSLRIVAFERKSHVLLYNPRFSTI